MTFQGALHVNASVRTNAAQSTHTHLEIFFVLMKYQQVANICLSCSENLI